MRARYFMTGSFNRRQRKEREALFGKLSDGLLPNRAFYWKADSGRILEIPVSTFPGCRIPIHATYLQYLASYSAKAAASYWSFALKAFHATGGSPSFLLHPLDFTGKDEQPDLAFFPGMNLPTRDKIRGTHRFLDMLREQFELLTMQQFADLQSGRDLPERPIRRVRRNAS
jgi:hypothetical protein